MRLQAIELGKAVIAIEQDIDDGFSSGTMTEGYLRERVSESAALYGRLRVVHLKYHLPMIDLLTPDEIATYNELRGYSTAADPCESIPEGHDPELWKLHNDCG